MLHHFLFFSLLAHAAWAKPTAVPSPSASASASPSAGVGVPVGAGDVAPHIVIVTPQAQVHLEPAAKFESSPASFVHHLAPVARLVTPGKAEETVVYYPASAVAATASAAAGRQSNSTIGIEQIVQIIQSGIQAGTSAAEQAAITASEAASAASQGAALFPWTAKSLQLLPTAIATASPAAQLVSDGHNLYALAPAASPLPPAALPLPQIIDLVPSPSALGPVFVAPAAHPLIRARSLEHANAALPTVALPIPDAPKPEALHVHVDSEELAKGLDHKKELAKGLDHKKELAKGLDQKKESEEDQKQAEAEEPKKPQLPKDELRGVVGKRRVLEAVRAAAAEDGPQILEAEQSQAQAEEKGEKKKEKKEKKEEEKKEEKKKEQGKNLAAELPKEDEKKQEKQPEKKQEKEQDKKQDQEQKPIIF